MSCMTILLLNLQITRSDVRPHIKQAISLVNAYGHFNFPQRFVWVVICENQVQTEVLLAHNGANHHTHGDGMRLPVSRRLKKNRKLSQKRVA